MPKGVGAVEPWRLCLDVCLKIDARRPRRASEVQAGLPHPLTNPLCFQECSPGPHPGPRIDSATPPADRGPDGPRPPAVPIPRVAARSPWSPRPFQQGSRAVIGHDSDVSKKSLANRQCRRLTGQVVFDSIVA